MSWMDFSTDRSFRLVNESGPSPIVVICDHASNRVPAEYRDLGLDRNALGRHIAWDIGAAAVSELLAARFGAPAILAGMSRLVIDCNRGFEDPSLVPATSDGTEVPGNQGLSQTERQARWERWHQPYHQAIRDAVERKLN